MEALSRSQFVKLILGFFAALWAAMASFPVVRYLISGARKQSDDGAQISELSLGAVDDFLPSSSKNFKFGSKPALLIRNEAGDFFAYNAVCTHLGCTVQHSSEKKNIFCACHGGQFDVRTGKNVGGPPPKPLTALVVESSTGEIIVKRPEREIKHVS